MWALSAIQCAIVWLFWAPFAINDFAQCITQGVAPAQCLAKFLRQLAQKALTFKITMGFGNLVFQHFGV